MPRLSGSGMIAAALALVLLGAACRGEPDGPGPGHKHKRPPETRLPPNARGKAPPVTRLGRADEATRAGDSFTVLLDGNECADPDYVDEVGQPAALFRVTEPDGRPALLLADLSVSPAAFEHNLRTWLDQRGLAPRPQVRGHILLTHAHTFAPLFAPRLFATPWDRTRGLAVADEWLGSWPVSGPNFRDFCRGPDKAGGPGAATRLCGPRGQDLQPGLARIHWSDGSQSQRLWTYTYATSPPEVSDVPFQPLETVLILRREEGYLLYSTCSHRPVTPTGERPRLHVIEAVGQLVTEGSLPPGPVTTLVTGSCGLLRTALELSTEADSVYDFIAARFAGYREEYGLREVVLVHCGAMRKEGYEPLHRVFGDRLKVAFPGASLPL